MEPSPSRGEEGTIPGDPHPSSLPPLVSHLPPRHPPSSDPSSLSLGQTEVCLQGVLPAQAPPPGSRKVAHSALTLFPDMEWMPIHTRAYVSTLAGYVFSLGQFILAGAAYAVPHWRYLQLLVSVPFFVSFVYSWCVGPRVGRGRHRSPEDCQGQDIPQIMPNTHPTESEKVKARRLKPGHASARQPGKGLWGQDLAQSVQVSAFPSSPHPPPPHPHPHPRARLPVRLPLPSTQELTSCRTMSPRRAGRCFVVLDRWT